MVQRSQIVEASDVCHFNEFEYILNMNMELNNASDVCHFNEFEYCCVVSLF